MDSKDEYAWPRGRQLKVQGCEGSHQSLITEYLPHQIGKLTPNASLYSN